MNFLTLFPSFFPKAHSSDTSANKPQSLAEILTQRAEWRKNGDLFIGNDFMLAKKWYVYFDMNFSLRNWQSSHHKLTIALFVILIILVLFAYWTNLECYCIITSNEKFCKSINRILLI